MAKKVPEGTVRERLLTAANELFYEEGIHTVGIDRVLERAGVAKASLYSTFGSKDDLIAAYLEGRHERRQRRIHEHIARHREPRARILSIFDLLAELSADPRFRGCAFVRASAESPGKKVRAVCDDARAWVRSVFADLARELGAADPDGLAHQLTLLYDGATVSASMDHDATAAATARKMAAVLVDAAARR